jgi:hypothetical protein
MPSDFEIVFKPSGRGPARCPTDPDFPDGVVIVLAPEGAPRCIVKLPYPAPECGAFLCKCRRCAFSVYVTAAGRPDDPREVVLACKTKAEAN